MSRERTPRTGCCQFLASSLCFQKLRATGGFEFFFTILTIDGTIQKSGEQFRGRCHKVRKPLRCNGFEPASFLSTRHKPNPLNRNGLRGFRFAFQGCFEPPYFPYFRIFSGHLGARCCKSVANFFDPLCHAFSRIASLTFSAVFPSRERRS